MKALVFLPSSTGDLRWFHRYYSSAFPEGRAKAIQQFQMLRHILRETPSIGHPSDLVPQALEFPIRKTPFTIVYRVMETEVQVLRIYDQRSAFASGQ